MQATSPVVTMIIAHYLLVPHRSVVCIGVLVYREREGRAGYSSNCVKVVQISPGRGLARLEWVAVSGIVAVNWSMT